MKWTNCNDCDSEYRVISDLDNKHQYCPFCGSLIEDSLDEDDLDEDEY